MRVAINAMVLGRRDTGVGLWIRGLIQALAGADRENEYVVYHRREAEPVLRRETANVRFVRARVPDGNRLARIAWEQSVLPGRLRRDAMEVLHCPAYVMPCRADLPTVATLHDLFVFTHPLFCRRLNVLHFRLTLPATVRRAALLHCTSNWTRGALCQLFPDAGPRARVVHPAADDIFRPQDPGAVERFRRDRGLKEPPFLFVGNVEPKKNVGALLEGLAVLKARDGLRRRLLMVGTRGWGGRRTEARIGELGLSGDVTRWGYVRRDELPLVYAASLALVLPSVVEGFGLPPIEAMACGTPVVTTGAGGLAESAGAAALRVVDDSPEALAESMHLIESSADLRTRLRAAGLRRASLFRWDRAARQMVDLYREASGAAI